MPGLVWSGEAGGEASGEASVDARVETEYHFIYECSYYDNIRLNWLQNIVKPDNFGDLGEGEKLSIALNASANIMSTAKFITTAYSMRSKKINK